MATMEAITERGTIKTITTHYIDGAFVESHGREVMDIIKPTNGKVIARVTLGDEEDTRRAIAAAKRAFVTSAGQQRKSARATCAACTRLSWRASMILRPRWWKSTEVLYGSQGLSCSRGSMPSPPRRRDSTSCL